MGKCVLFRCESPCYKPALRHVVAIMSLFLIFVMYLQLIAARFILIEMSLLPFTKNKTECCQDVEEEMIPLYAIPTAQIFSRTEKSKRIIWGMYYVGYIPFLIIFGYLCDKLGVRKILLYTTGCSIFISLVFPAIINNLHWGFTAFFVFLVGITQSAKFPGSLYLLNNWILPIEITKFGSIVFAGDALGIFVGNFATPGLIYASKNWEAPFYVYGAITGICLILFGIYVYSTPSNNPRTDPEEVTFIETYTITPSNFKIPIKEIISDQAVWAMVFGEFSLHITIILCSNTSQYMNNVLGMNKTNTRIAYTVPFLGTYIIAVIMGFFTDFILKRYNFKKILFRKFCTFVGTVFPAIIISLSTFGRCSRPVVITLVVIAFLIHGISYCGTRVNCLDLSRNYGAFVIGLANAVGSLSGLFCPVLLSWASRENTIHEWATYCWIVTIIILVSSFLFVLLGSGKRREWDIARDEKGESDMKWYMERTPAEHVLYRELVNQMSQ